MTISTTPRLGLTQWSSGNDSFGRAQLEASLAAIDAQAAIDIQGTAASRPAFGVVGRYYYATDTGVLTRDTGTAWIPVNHTVAPTATSTSHLASPLLGQMEFDTDTNQLAVWNGSVWVAASNLTMFGAGTATNGSTPSLPAGQWLFQGGTTVYTTNGGGGSVVGLPKTFPNGVLTTTISVGDNVTVGLGLQLINSQQVVGGFGFVTQIGTAAAVNAGPYRVDWMTVGF